MAATLAGLMLQRVEKRADGPMDGDVRELSEADIQAVFDVINAAAQRYRGRIPDAADTDPYMPKDELAEAMDEMAFLGIGEPLAGVIGLQERGDASLIRHLYVRPGRQRAGLGSALLEAGLERAASDRILVGTWRAADWAIDFYEANGFDNRGTDLELLRQYWDIPSYHAEASVVLEFAPDG